jgi:23S rRNA (uracil1939-C5)-methyltransferase
MQVKIEKLIYGGEGLGHADGHTVFVPFVLPEEVVRIHPREKKKKFVRGELQQVVVASPQRTAAACKHFTRCGGCHYQHIPYDAQLTFKTDILRETLSRVGRVRWEGPIETHASPPVGYRNRAQWKVRNVGGAPCIGYFRAGTTALSPAEQCPILSPRLEAMLATLRHAMAHGEMPDSLREIEAFADSSDEKVLLNLSFTDFPQELTELCCKLRDLLPGVESMLLHESSCDRFELKGPGFVATRVNEFEFRVGHLSFFQANRFLLEELQRTVTGDARGALALDLYCGVGLFTVPLAQQFNRVIAVESNSAAVRDLEANVGARGTAVHVMQKEVGTALERIQERPDVVVLDPPRAGVEKQALQRLLALGAPEVRYLSCDPATLARDLAAFVQHGYQIEAMHLFDLFPQTYHIETLAGLRRAE